VENTIFHHFIVTNENLSHLVVVDVMLERLKEAQHVT